MKARTLLSIILLLTLTLCTASALALAEPERLVYSVSWRGIKAGSAVQEITAQGDDIRIVNSIRSSSLVSAIFHIDDRKESVIPRRGENDPLGPRYYWEKINEGKVHRQREARFDHLGLKVYTEDQLNKTKKVDRISPGTYDTLSSIYFIRSSVLVPGQSIHFHLYDFRRLWTAEVRVVKREEIRTSLGTFNTLVVTSELVHNEVPERIGSSTVWLTDDSRKVPVKIKAATKSGDITLTLVGGSYWRNQ